MLIIQGGPIYPFKYELPRKGQLGFRWPIWKLIKAKFSQRLHHVVCHKPETILDKLLHAVPALTTLTTLDVHISYNWEDPFVYSMKSRVITACWPICAANLTTLSLYLPLEEIHLILLPHITLLQLEKISITLHIFCPTSEPNKLIQKSILPFLINHGSTLQLLKLEAQEKMDMSSILTDLQHMPWLNSLHVSHHFVSWELTSFVGHHQFLEAH